MTLWHYLGLKQRHYDIFAVKMKKATQKGVASKVIRFIRIFTKTGCRLSPDQ